MKMIRAIVRPEKVEEVLEALIDAGYPAVTRMDVYGRGKQKGLQVGGVGEIYGRNHCNCKAE
ncbi:MAG: P-II family nitrogen regulator [Lachnospiraceae bacterium]